MKPIKQSVPVPARGTRGSKYIFLKMMQPSDSECVFIPGTTERKMRNAISSHVRRHGGSFIVRSATVGKRSGVRIWRME